MLSRKRTSVSIPEELIAPGSIGQRELAAVQKWMDEGLRPAMRPGFRAYKERAVVKALEELFSGKCAYCESSYSTTQPVDIEHWRPKGGIRDVTSGDLDVGYPWLAMAWDNLLPSCIDCNRARSQHVLRPNDKGELCWMEVLQGKANQFPLLDENSRARSYNGDIDREFPLLINPCADDPARFLFFDRSGVVLPRPELELHGVMFKQALTSIEVYALNRKALVDARREIVLRLEYELERIRDLMRLSVELRNKGIFDSASVTDGMVISGIEGLVSMSLPDRPYAQLVSQILSTFLRGLEAGRIGERD